MDAIDWLRFLSAADRPLDIMLKVPETHVQELFFELEVGKVIPAPVSEAAKAPDELPH
jgi:hypothetical protein